MTDKKEEEGFPKIGKDKERPQAEVRDCEGHAIRSLFWQSIPVTTTERF
ncbi:MAG: hypothetical protein ACM3ON_08185 [Chloroflexota bacterium]